MKNIKKHKRILLMSFMMVLAGVPLKRVSAQVNEDEIHPPPATEIQETLELVKEYKKPPSSNHEEENESLNSDSVLLGRIVDQANHQAIEIDCIDGTKEKCKRIGFFMVFMKYGARAEKPFVTQNLIDLTLPNKPKFYYSRVSGPVYGMGQGVSTGVAEAGATGEGILLLAGGFYYSFSFMPLFPQPIVYAVIPALLAAPFVLDVMLTPYSLVKYLVSLGQYKRAYRSMMNALVKGEDIYVRHGVWKRLKESLSAGSSIAEHGSY